MFILITTLTANFKCFRFLVCGFHNEITEYFAHKNYMEIEAKNKQRKKNNDQAYVTIITYSWFLVCKPYSFASPYTVICTNVFNSKIVISELHKNKQNVVYSTETIVPECRMKLCARSLSLWVWWRHEKDYIKFNLKSQFAGYGDREEGTGNRVELRKVYEVMIWNMQTD